MNPFVKLALEIGPLVVFFGAFQLFKGAPVEVGGVSYDAVVVATALFVPAILASLAASWAMTRSLPKMAVLTAVVVVIFGGLTIALNDETFIKMKPTIVNGLFALALGVGLLQGRSYLKYLMGEALPLNDAGWMIFTKRWALFFVFLAVLNEAIWRTQSTDFWVAFKTFGNLPLTLAFMASQWPMLKRHGLGG
ncbi:MAG: septation protein A [Rubrimonas sp.]|uniref:septation protein A n=1 Tax=Rubrimonas sp. TaxID=2036015 RepID=UPI002FDE7A45